MQEALQNERDGVQNSDAILVINQIDDESAAQMFFDLKQGGVLDRVFYQEPATLRWFMDWCTNPSTSTIVCVEGPNSDAPGRFIGVAWINNRTTMFNYAKAEIGFAFFHKTPVWKAVKCGRKMLKWAFDTLNVDFLWGTTPKQNPAAVAYAKRLGFKVIAELPDYTVWEGTLTSVILTRIAKSEFYAREYHGRTIQS